jgi:hypothetical protein
MKQARVWCVAFVLWAAALVSAAESLRIVPLVVGETVVVSAELKEAYSTDLREAIASGLRTSFTYTIDLRVNPPMWVDRTVATAIVTVADEYDNLTRRHHLSRFVDGRLVDTLVTEDDEEVRRWLTTLNRVTVCATSKLDSRRDYYVRISAQVGPQRASLLGWARATTGSVRFTFIP